MPGSSLNVFASLIVGLKLQVAEMLWRMPRRPAPDALNALPPSADNPAIESK